MIHHAIILIVCVAIAAAAFVLNGDELGVFCFGYELPVQCPLHQFTGIKCSLCGLTRSLCSFAHGDFPESFKFHHIGPAIFVFICLQIPYRMWAIFIHPGWVNRKLAKANAIVFLLLLAAVLTDWLIYLGGLIL